MIGIIGAMKAETDGIIQLLERSEKHTVGGIDFFTGKYSGKELVVATCGVGKVFAAMCAEAMIISYNPDVIINIGVSGSLSRELHINDIVLGSSFVQHDMDTSSLGDEPGMISGINRVYFPTDEKTNAILESALNNLKYSYKIGGVASGDQFVSQKEEKDRIVKQFGAITCEMEGAGIAQVCYVNNTPFAAIRSISDEADESSSLDFPVFLKIAAEKSISVVKEFIKLY